MDMLGSEGFRIGVISDTHGLLRPEALRALAGVRHIIHAGDIGAPGLIGTLGETAPVTAIRGNVDRDAWAAEYPEARTIRLGGLTIRVLHDLKRHVRELESDPPDVVIFGHSHRPSIESRDGTLFLNPGSAGPRRFRLPVTVAILTVIEGSVRPELHKLLD